MKDDVWKRDEIASPCVKLCVVHPDARICVGCFRTIAEISAWSTYSLEERARLIAELPAREPQIKHRRGGRAARLDRSRD